MNTGRTPLTLQAFEALLELHGAALDRWPAQPREAARALLDADPAARALLDEAARLDAALDALDEVEPSAALRRAVAEIPLRHPQPAHAPLVAVPAWFPFRSLGHALMLALLALSLGALLGLYDTAGGPAPLATGEPPDAGIEPVEPDDESGYLAALAFADDLDEELTP